MTINIDLQKTYEIKSNYISICIPTYNRATFLETAIHSALIQNDDYFEIIIVDDGSTDDTALIVRKFDDPRINYVHKAHTNAPDTRNRCLQEACGEFILWLDSDDILEPNLLPRFRRNLAEFPDIDVCYGDIIPFGNLGRFPEKTIRHKDYYRKNGELLSEMISGNKIPNPGTFIRKSLFHRVGMYDIHFKRAHDYEFWIRSAPFATFKHIGGISLRWRWHETNMSAGNKKFDTSYESLILSKLVHLYPIDTLFPSLDWNNRSFAAFLAYGEIAKMFLTWNNIQKFIEYIHKAITSLYPSISLPNNKALILKIASKCYIEIYKQTQNNYFYEMAQVSLNLSKANNKL